MKRLRPGFCLAAILSLSLFSAAQTHKRMGPRVAGPLSYDTTKETTIQGTVTSVLQRPTRGMIMGSHVMLSTGSGSLDASLGAFGLKGKGVSSLAAGQWVEATGVRKTVRGKEVFLVRTVKIDGSIYTVRTVRGFPMSPQARERASRKPARKGTIL